MMVAAMKMPPEPVRFVRRFIVVVGVFTALCGFFWVTLALWRAINPVTPNPTPPVVRTVLALMLLAAILLIGICLIMLGASRVLWQRPEENLITPGKVENHE